MGKITVQLKSQSKIARKRSEIGKKRSEMARNGEIALNDVK